MCDRKVKVSAIYPLLILVAGLGMARSAHAVNGTFLTGNGTRADGMGGATVAFPQDTTVAADNPAGMAYVGNQLDLYGGLIVASFKSTFGSPNNRFTSSENIPISGGGVNYAFAPRWTVGVSVYGVGLGDNYHAPVAPGLGNAGANLVQVNAAPTLTYKVLPNLSIGASMILGLQQFRANGLFTVSPEGSLAAMPSHGTRYATGIGGAVGVLWNPSPLFSIGASYYSKMSFGKMPGYDSDLLAGTGGSLDGPSSYRVGIAVHPLPPMTLAVDYLRIQWGSTPPYNDASSFNWHNQNVVRMGFAYDVNSKLTLRTGVSLASSTIDSDHTAVNFYTAGVATKVLTAGFTYSIDKSNQVSMSYEHELPRTINGTGPSTGSNLHLNFQMATLGFTHKF
jgi:long-chain fatty acid transport protein